MIYIYDSKHFLSGCVRHVFHFESSEILLVYALTSWPCLLSNDLDQQTWVNKKVTGVAQKVAQLKDSVSYLRTAHHNLEQRLDGQENTNAQVLYHSLTHTQKQKHTHRD